MVSHNIKPKKKKSTLLTSSSGEALYRFLLSQCATSRPTYRIQIRGTHTESRSRIVTHRDAQGRSQTRTERYNDTITDFDFCVDVTPGAVGVDGAPTSERLLLANTPPIHWTVPDDVPAYRGKMVREYDVEPYKANAADVRTRLGEWSAETGRRSARRKEAKAYKKMMEGRMRRGFPPWGASNGAAECEDFYAEEQQDSSYPLPQDIQWTAGGGGGVYARNRGAALDPAAVSTAEKDTLRSSKTLRQWADEYCQSPKQLKEFVYTKVMHIFFEIILFFNLLSSDTIRMEYCPNRICNSCIHYRHTLQWSLDHRDCAIQHKDIHPSRQQSLKVAFKQMAALLIHNPLYLPIHLAVQEIPLEGRRQMGSRRRSLSSQNVRRCRYRRGARGGGKGVGSRR